MERDSDEAEVVEAARSWVQAKRAWDATSRALVRPPNLSRLKGDVGRAERRLMAAVDALGQESSDDGSSE